MKSLLQHVSCSSLLCLGTESPALRARWFEGGIPICTAADDQKHIFIVSDGTGMAVLAWDDNRYPHNGAARIAHSPSPIVIGRDERRRALRARGPLTRGCRKG